MTDKGGSSYTVKAWRVYYKDGKEVDRESLGSSTYDSDHGYVFIEADNDSNAKNTNVDDIDETRPPESSNSETSHSSSSNNTPSSSSKPQSSSSSSKPTQAPTEAPTDPPAPEPEPEPTPTEQPGTSENP